MSDDMPRDVPYKEMLLEVDAAFQRGRAAGYREGVEAAAHVCDDMEAESEACRLCAADIRALLAESPPAEEPTLDSPNFVAHGLRDLAARGYQRVNRDPARTVKGAGISSLKPDVRVGYVLGLLDAAEVVHGMGAGDVEAMSKKWECTTVAEQLAVEKTLQAVAKAIEAKAGKRDWSAK